MRDDRERADVINIALVLPKGWGIVCTTGRKPETGRNCRLLEWRKEHPYVLVVIISDYLSAVEDGEKGNKKPSVPVIRHPSSIVTLASQVRQRIQWQIIIVIQEHLGHVCDNIQRSSTELC